MGRRLLWVILTSALVSFELATSAGSLEAFDSEEPFAVAPDLIVNDVAFDPSTRRAYVVVAGRDRSYPNRLVAFDPADGSIFGSVFVGSEPDLLDVSTDGSVVWVGLAGEGAVVQVDAASLSVSRSISLRPAAARSRFAQALVSVPGDADSVVVATATFDGEHAGAVLVSNGALAPGEVDEWEGEASVVALSPTRMIAYAEGEWGSRKLWHLDVAANGLILDSSVTPANDRLGERLTYADGVLYGSRAVAVDPATGETIAQYSAFGGDDVTVRDGLVYVLDRNEIFAYSIETRELVETITLPGNPVHRAELTQHGWLTLPAFFTDDGSRFQTPTVGVPVNMQVATGREFEFAKAPDVRVEGVVYHRPSNRVFVAVPGSFSQPHELVEFDPATGTITRRLELDERPGMLELADDGSSLWVLLSDSHDLLQVDRESMGVVDRYSFSGLPGVLFRPLIRSLVPIPGDADAIAVSVHSAGVYLVRNGVIEPKGAAADHHLVHLIPLSGEELMGFSTIEPGLALRLTVVEDGLVEVSSTTWLTGVDEYGGGVNIDGGLLHTSQGFLIDPDTGVELGRFGVGGERARPITDRGAVLHTYERGRFVVEYDPTTFVRQGYPIRMYSSVQNLLVTDSGLLAWSTAGFSTGRVQYPMGALGGVVSDDLTGRGIGDLCVDVYDAADEDFEVQGTTKTNSAGSWRFSALRAGFYRVYYYECEFFEYFSAFHGGALPTNPGEAEIVEVVEGNPFSALRAGLRRFFEDVPRDSYYASSTIFMWHAGITTGCGIVRYCPESLVTREQMASFMARFWRLFAACPSSGPVFEDLPSWSFAYADASCVAAIGITNGVTPNTYDPSGEVTREQMAAFLGRLWRALGLTCPAGDMPFDDVSATSFARSDIVCIAELGITTGTTPTTYAPSDFVSRAQMAAFLDRLFRAALDQSAEIGTSSLSVSSERTDRPASTVVVDSLSGVNGLAGARR